MQLSLDSTPVANSIMKLLERREGSWAGTPTQLLEDLTFGEGDRVRSSRSWPGSAQALSRRLTLLAPALREAGVEVEIGTIGRGNAKTRWIELHDARQRPGDAGDAGDANRA